MPVYEFTCQDCHKTFEVTRPMSEGSACAPCPDCGRPYRVPAGAGEMRCLACFGHGTNAAVES